MFERLTQQARAVVVSAHEQAADLGHGWVGTEHLLLGLAELGDDPDAIGPRTLRELGSDPEAAEAGPPGPYQPLVALTAPAVPVLELARQQAVQDGSGGRVGTHHLLLALLSQQDTQAARLLASFGVDYPLVKARLMEIGEDEPVEPPRPAPPRAPSNTRPVELPHHQRFTVLVGEVARLLPPGAALGFNSDGDVAWIVTSGNVDLPALVEQAR